MTLPDAPTGHAALPEIPGIATAGAEPHFFAPWQAKAFAMTVALADAGVIAWPDWTDAFAARLRTDTALPDMSSSADHADQYFMAWLATLEDFSAAQGIPPEAVAGAAAKWQRAAQATPHGQPILFEAGREF